MREMVDNEDRLKERTTFGKKAGKKSIKWE